jgi:hypothetical protein
MDTLLIVGGFFVLFLILLLVAIIPLYLLMAFGFYAMAKNAELENSWLTFVPIVNFYIMGKLIKEIKISSYVIPNAEFVLPGAIIVSIILGAVPVLGNLICLCSFILFLIAYYHLYSLYRPQNAALYTALSVLCVTVPFFVFMMRNDAMVENLKTQDNQDTINQGPGQ